MQGAVSPLTHRGLDLFSYTLGPGYIIVLCTERGAQPTCNANTQRVHILSSEPLWNFTA